MELRTSGLETQTERAKADVAKAGAEIAKANEAIAEAKKQTASLQKDAAQARLETERLKETVAWREVTPAQAALLAEALRGQHFAIPLSFTANDPEAARYADQLADALVAAGIITTLPTVWAGGPVVRIRLSQTDTPETERFKVVPFTLSGATPELRMSVGSKPRNR